MSENLLKTLPKGAEPVASGPSPPDEDDEFCMTIFYSIGWHDVSVAKRRRLQSIGKWDRGLVCEIVCQM